VSVCVGRIAPRGPCTANNIRRITTAESGRRASTRRGLGVALAGAIRHTITGYVAWNQERQASARRGRRTEPSPARTTHRWPNARPRNKSGEHPPAVGSEIALATATGFRERIKSAPRIRLPHHGWLTPAAPGARRRCTEKTTFAVHNRMFPRVARINPPWPANRTQSRENHAPLAERATPGTGAAGVSPPWFGNRDCDCVRQRFKPLPASPLARRGSGIAIATATSL